MLFKTGNQFNMLSFTVIYIYNQKKTKKNKITTSLRQRKNESKEKIIK